MHDWQASASATLVGSMPHLDRQKAIDLILQAVPEIPVWPQLSNNKAEQMMVQYLEGLPGIHGADGELVVLTDTPEFETELYKFYEEYLEVESAGRDLLDSRFKMGAETGKTFFEFLDTLHQTRLTCKAVKGQIVGPFTLLTGLKDLQDRALLYDERFPEVVTKHLAMKAKWQIEHLKSAGYPVIIFLDEPALAGFGSSAFISVSRELIQELLKEVIDAVHEAGALAGIHICANTDWMLAFDSAVDIINFDAYNYFEKFALYKEPFTRFLAQNRTVAWGIIPTGDTQIINRETSESLADRWMKGIDELCSSELTRETILSKSLFTPSCGCASLSEEAAERVLILAREVGQIMRGHL